MPIMKAISILIPTYNDPCHVLVSDLQRQAESLSADYEIIVADDGSTDEKAVKANRAVNDLPHCRYIERGINSGRAAIRNFLAQQARHDHLLFIDSDMVICRPDFVRSYAEADGDVVDGGLVIGKAVKGNLRSMYEKKAEQEHAVERRREAPYQDFHTANFMVRRDIMLAHPFDERFRHYGYEDVFFGKSLQQHGIAIHHIDNPLCFEVYETNDSFVSKTEEGLRTLFTFRKELEGYSRMIAWSNRVPRLPIRLWHALFGQWERRNLTGSHPLLTVFNLYRMGYYASLF